MLVNVDNQMYIREEANGIIVYTKRSNLYKFYESVSLDEISGKDFGEITNFLESKQDRINHNVKIQFPLRANWLIERRCNLDCIYCLAADTMGDTTPDLAHFTSIVDEITSLNLINVGLTGGEPMLCPYLPKIIEALSRKVSVNLDTNGTIPITQEMLQLFKQHTVLVRISVDTFDDELLSKIRPNFSGRANYIQKMKNNIALLIENNIPMMVHTVVTSLNINHLAALGDILLSLGVWRWHLYAVNPSEKCKDTYDSIRVTSDDMRKLEESLSDKFKGKMQITTFFDYGENSILMINSKGELMFNGIFDGSSTSRLLDIPLDKIMKTIDVNAHVRTYLWTSQK